jgi:hypothetical protein
MKNTKLTSVKVIEELYNCFKKETIDNGFNLQKLVNRSIYKYTTDEEFRDDLHGEDGLKDDGTCF